MVPSAYGRSVCCCGVSGAGSGSMRSATMTELVVSSLFQRSGTVDGLLDAPTIFGGGAFFGGFSGVGSFDDDVDVVGAGRDVNERLIRIGPAGRRRRTASRSSYANSGRRLVLVVFLRRSAARPAAGVLRDDAPVRTSGSPPVTFDGSSVTVNGTYCLLPWAFSRSS